MVSELGELRQCEGEALSKIDSLGYQLASLLETTTDGSNGNDVIMGLDVSHRVFFAGVFVFCVSPLPPPVDSVRLTDLLEK